MIVQLSFLLLPIAAGCGWYYGRKDRHQQQHPATSLRRDYFKGLNYLINEQPDKAVDVFIRLLEVDSDTVETHLALGNLFRQRGEVDRAIRIHQNLIARPQLEKSYRLQALSALGQDYLAAGVLDRAEKLFLELVDHNEQSESSLRFLLQIYQQEKDWSQAASMALRLEKNTGESMHVAVAHYYCELAEESCEHSRITEAYTNLKRAQQVDSNCARASMILGRMAYQAGYYKEAIKNYKKILHQDADYLAEIVKPLEKCYRRLNQEQKFIQYMRECLEKYPRIQVILAIADYLQTEKDDQAAIDFLTDEFKHHPSLRGLSYLVNIYLDNSYGDTREKLQLLQNYIRDLLANRPVYQCMHCGYSGKTLFWQCPTCHHWAEVKPIKSLEGS